MDTLDTVLLEVLADDVDMLDDETPWSACPSWDSLKHVELIVAVESRFGAELSADDIARLTSKRMAREILTSKGKL